jgi:hypothetical protein
MNTRVATGLGTRTRRSARAIAIQSIGPLTVLAGIVWAFLQPYRVTLLDPEGQGFWWLFTEPPLFVIVVGVVFHTLVAPGVVSDLEHDTTGDHGKH